jgi:hypothetical protein
MTKPRLEGHTRRIVKAVQDIQKKRLIWQGCTNFDACSASIFTSLRPGD